MASYRIISLPVIDCVCPPIKNYYVETLIPNVMVFGDEASEEAIRS